MSRYRSLTPALLLGAALAACGKTPPPQTAANVAPTARSGADTVLDLLLAGEEGKAKKQLKQLLKRDPLDPRARLLDDSIRRSPTDLLGPASYAYTVRSGDSYRSLAERVLGNRFKAYQLARYNDAHLPATLASGDIIRMPGEAPRIAPAKPSQPTRTPPSPGKARTSVEKPVAAARSVAAPPSADPATAARTRAAGLAALNRGDVVRAIVLLRRARASAPADPVIARDLARAERIGQTVRARR